MKLHVVTCVNNPVRYQSRYRLYRDLARHMQDSGVSLYTVECASGARPFELTDAANPRQLQLRTLCEMWHKEPEMLNYLDRVHDQLAKLPVAEEVKGMAVRQELLRRQPKLLQAESTQAAALRGVMLMCTVVLSNAGDAGQQAASAVHEIFRRAYRASSLVECINSVLRMQQAQHRQMTQGLLDLKRLYWNCHRFRSGHRRNSTPYERLGIPWPERLRWWDVLKLTPQQLQNKLSTTKTAA